MGPKNYHSFRCVGVIHCAFILISSSGFTLAQPTAISSVSPNSVTGSNNQQPPVVTSFVNISYPIIFIHGYYSNDDTWDSAIDFLSTILGTPGDDQSFHVVLNAYPGLRRIEGPDGQLGTRDDDVLVPLLDEAGNTTNQLVDGNLFAINFQNFWVENSDPPRIRIHNSDSPGPSESDGNESAIFKQGYALKLMIEKVRAATGANKVILVGHSMGGLAAREYLQRHEAGRPKWWIDLYSPEGHKVAKLVTIGTPPFGNECGFSVFGSIHRRK